MENAKSRSAIGSKNTNERQQAMVATYTGLLGSYSVHMINHKNVINMHSNDVILPVLTLWHTQCEQTIKLCPHYDPDRRGFD